MRIFEYRAYGNPEQYAAIDEAIRTTQFVRNKCIRLWMDAKDIPYNVGKSEISKHTTELKADYTWAKKLNATAVGPDEVSSRVVDRLLRSRGYLRFGSLNQFPVSELGSGSYQRHQVRSG